MSEKYNGWTNYETWVVNIWMDNDQGTQEYWAEQALGCWEDTDEDDNHASRMNDATYALSQMIQTEHEENAPEVTGPFADLLNGALSEVNWHEIAVALLASLEIEAES